MRSLFRRRVVSPIVGTKNGDLVTIPVGAIIEMSADLDQPGLYSVIVGDEEFFAFTRDIEERTERIDPSPEFRKVVVRQKTPQSSF
jgi:hypothetical protein